MALPTRSGFDTSADRSGGGARELEVARELRASPLALLAGAEHGGRVIRHDDRHRELGDVEDAAAERGGTFSPSRRFSSSLFSGRVDEEGTTRW